MEKFVELGHGGVDRHAVPFVPVRELMELLEHVPDEGPGGAEGGKLLRAFARLDAQCTEGGLAPRGYLTLEELRVALTKTGGETQFLPSELEQFVAHCREAERVVEGKPAQCIVMTDDGEGLDYTSWAGALLVELEAKSKKGKKGKKGKGKK